MENLVCGTVTFNKYDIDSLEHVLKAIKDIRLSEQAGWESFYKKDYELQELKDFICKECLFAWEKREERINGKKVHGQNKLGDRKVGKEVRKRK